MFLVPSMTAELKNSSITAVSKLHLDGFGCKRVPAFNNFCCHYYFKNSTKLLESDFMKYLYPKLTELSISFCELSERTLINVLKQCTGLKTLHLSDITCNFVAHFDFLLIVAYLLLISSSLWFPPHFQFIAAHFLLISCLSQQLNCSFTAHVTLITTI